MFTFDHLRIVRLCAIECELQQSGEQSVWLMLRAWEYALEHSMDGRLPDETDVKVIATLIEPAQNKRGYRRHNVQVGWSVKGPWEDVPRLMADLMLRENLQTLTPKEFFRRYEEIHPLGDGNGRSGLVLYCWLSGTLRNPDWAPDFWNDHRRTSGFGAPTQA